MPVNPVREGFHTVTPYLIVSGGAKMIEFLKTAFGAEEIKRFSSPEGIIMCSEIKIGNSMIMLGEMKEGQSMPCTLYLYVSDPDAAYKRALDAGAVPVKPPSDEFYGDRTAGVRDLFGNFWWLAVQKEDLSAKEIERRFKEREAQEGRESEARRTIGFK